MKKTFFKILFLFLCLFKNGIKAQTLTLKQCVEQAIQNNISIKQTGLLADNARINLSQAKSNQLPERLKMVKILRGPLFNKKNKKTKL